MTRARLDRGDDRGAATLFVVAFATALLVVAGLVVDGGLAINARQRVADDVEQAARAGSENLDLQALRERGVVRIESGAAEAAAARFMSVRNYAAGEVQVEAGPGEVTVSARIQQPTALLSLIHIDHFTISAQGTARPAVGIEEETGGDTL